jgi:hypothetical protein
MYTDTGLLLFAYLMGQTPSLMDESSSRYSLSFVTQRICYLVHRKPSTVPTLSQKNPVHILSSSYLKEYQFSFVPVEKVHQSPSSCTEFYKTGFLG